MAKDTPIPTSGLLEISSELSRIKAARNAFGIYDKDDISQEIWLAVDKAAPKFDLSKLPPGKRALAFFNFVSENILKNLRRDVKEIDTIPFEAAPSEIEDHTLAGVIRAREIYEYILERLSPKLKKPFEDLVNNGGENVSSYMKTQIRQEAARILLEFYDEQ
jgi:DNA-directed RNA polymerase specialized sigma24 family protein